MNLVYEVWDNRAKWSNIVSADCYAAANYGSTIIAVLPSADSGISVKMEAYLNNDNGRYGAAILVYLGPDTPKALLDTPYHLKRVVTIVLNVLQRQPNFKIGTYHLTPSSALPDVGNKVGRDILDRIKEMLNGQINGERTAQYCARSSWS